MADRYHLPWLAPDPVSPIQTVLEAHALAQEFRREVDYRQEQEAYCQWYADLCKTHQAELSRMRQEVNLFSFFYGFRQ
ncbi:MAG: hypothetical protein ACO3EZ_19045 [Prochlorotrichaceae cyanobacterium]